MALTNRERQARYRTSLKDRALAPGPVTYMDDQWIMQRIKHYELELAKVRASIERIDRGMTHHEFINNEWEDVTAGYRGSKVEQATQLMDLIRLWTRDLQISKATA